MMQDAVDTEPFLINAPSEEKTRSVDISKLADGMALAENIATSKGRLLIARGTLLTSELVWKVHNFNKIDAIN
jgi:hypothetical protein